MVNKKPEQTEKSTLLRSIREVKSQGTALEIRETADRYREYNFPEQTPTNRNLMETCAG